MSTKKQSVGLKFFKVVCALILIPNSN